MDAILREERDPGFWIGVARHPAVRPTLLGCEPESLIDIVRRGSVLPLAAKHGGFLFSGLDALQRVYELHTLFTPEGWGREVHAAAKAAFNHVLGPVGGFVVVTYEPESNPRGRPPRSFGFRPAGEMADTPLGRMRTWVLTKAAWQASRGAASCPSL